MAEVMILGSAFAIANAEQENSYLLIKSEKRNVLIDCGNNPVGRIEKAGLQINEITDLVLTHAHADHMGALPLLLMDMWLMKRQTPLTIFGLEYTLERTRMLLEVFNWQNWTDMFLVEFQPLTASGPVVLFSEEDIALSVIQVEHSVPTLSVRADFKKLSRSVIYSSDTHPCENFDRLATGVEIMVHEAAGTAAIHTSPTQAGTDARKAGAKKLILIHYDSNRQPGELLAEARMDYDGEVELARDLMKVI
jgi:ribonuclease Z